MARAVRSANRLSPTGFSSCRARFSFSLMGGSIRFSLLMDASALPLGVRVDGLTKSRCDTHPKNATARFRGQVVAELKAALAAHAKTAYQTPMAALDCSAPRLKRVLASGHWQPFLD